MAQDVRRRSTFLYFLLSAGLAVTPGQTGAWGGLGHRLVCAVALMPLADDERAEVARLASRFRGPGGLRYRYFTGGCTFADKARSRARDGVAGWRDYTRFERWHFLNAPRRARAVRTRHCDDDCVLTGIEHHYRLFADRDRGDERRAEAMLLIAHWIADAHQPMHVAFADDFGGNAMDIAGGYYEDDDMHGVWDRGVVEKLVGVRDWWSFAEALSASVTEDERRWWSGDSPVAWVDESFQVSIDPRTRYCRMRANACEAMPGARRLGASYQRYAQDIVRERIRRAGVRLAAYLSRGLRQAFTPQSQSIHANP